MSPDFRRGAAAIEKASERSKGNFAAFTPNIIWKDDREEKYLLFLNPVDDIPTVDLITFIPVHGKKANGDTFTYYESTLARTDSALGGSSDKMVEDWDAKPRQTSLAVAVVLEPKVETKNGRPRPVGFEVATTEFERRIRDEEGNLTSDTETVKAPVVGFVAQSPLNFFNIVSSYDANDAPIEETPLKITRIGKDSNTVYQVQGYIDQQVDLSGLLDNIEGIAYLDDADEVAAALEDSDQPAAMLELGTILLDKRLEQLADEDRYDGLYEGITESLDKFGGGKKKTEARPKQARKSQRKAESNGDDSDSDTASRLEKLRQRAEKRKES